VQPMLAGQVDYVIGVDTHRDSNTAAIVEAATGGVIEDLQCPTDAMGYRRCHAFATKFAPGRRVWAIEGSGSFGSGLTTFLLERGEWVVEIDRPSRPARRNGAKSDELDAVRAAREALSREHLAAPRTRGDREALRVLLTARQGAVVGRTKAIGQLKALIVNAPKHCATNCAAAPPTNSSNAARACGPPLRSPSSTAPPSEPSAQSPGARSTSKGRQPSTRATSRSSS